VPLQGKNIDTRLEKQPVKRNRPLKVRIDTLLVERGLAESRQKAQALILAGEVLIGDRAVDKPGSLVDGQSPVRVAGKAPYVSRGGLKLEYALETFGVDVKGLTALDVGASTGGFTDCLLKHGASLVYALDVGYGQLDWGLRKDPRVVVFEKVNAHHPFVLPGKADVATIDLSFISVTKVLPNVVPWLTPEGLIIVLLKPQFEAEKKEVGKGGIIKDPLIHARVLGRFVDWCVNNGFRLGGLEASPIKGAEGNKEFLALLSKPVRPRAIDTALEWLKKM